MKGIALVAAALSFVFEPTVAIDPDRPDRIVAGAQFGEGYNRGGLRFQTWVTTDGARTWSTEEVFLRVLERPPTMAADLSLAFGLEGELFGFGIEGDGFRDQVPEAALAFAISQDGGKTFTPRALLGESVDHPDGSFSVSDKPWLSVDRGPESPFRGSLYFAWTRIHVRKRDAGYDLEPTLVFSVSRDQGRSHSGPLSIAESGSGAQIAVRGDGTIDLVWVEEEANRSGRIVHAFSRDGGATFSEPKAVETLADTEESLDLPTLAVSPTGVLSACWARGPISTTAGTSIRCSGYGEEAGWTAPVSVSMEGLASGYPALAGTGDAFWLLSYHAGETLRVSLYCSRDGRGFDLVETLSEAPLPSERFCARSGFPCRKDPETFTPGDYVGLAASSRRLAAAYVLPGDEVVTSVVDLGSEACSVAGVQSFRH